jgi:hypothetical protein
MRTTTSSGYLYKSDGLQVGVKMISGVGHEMKIKIFYGNKTDDDMENLTATVNAPAGIDIKLVPAEPITVEAKQQKFQFAKINCKRPYSEIPSITIKFQHDGDDNELELRLPVTVFNFMTPYECEQPQFVNLWRKYTTEKKQVVTLDMDADKLKEDVAAMLHLHEVDTDTAATALIGAFNVIRDDGSTMKMVAMASMMFKGNKAQVVFRSQHMSVVDALMTAFTAIAC